MCLPEGVNGLLGRPAILDQNSKRRSPAVYDIKVPRKWIRLHKGRQRSVVRGVQLWKAAQPFIDPDSLVFLDETGVNTKMARLYGWSPVGERCRDSVPFGHVWTPPRVQAESSGQRGA